MVCIVLCHIWCVPQAQVAVKVPNVDGEELDAVMNDLEREIRTMHSLDHKYIVKLIGISDGRRSLLLLDHTHLNPPPPPPPFFFAHCRWSSSSLPHNNWWAYPLGHHGVCLPREPEVLSGRIAGGEGGGGGGPHYM